MKSRKLLVLSLVVALVMMVSVSAFACTSIMVGKNASADGSVMTAHTCDGNYDARIRIIPGQTWEPGAMAPVYVNLCTDTIREPSYVGEIPQAEQTYTYFHIGYPFMNEHSVLVGEATWSGRRELRNNEAMLNIEQLTAFALQRSTNAREFIQVAGELAETYGYCDGGEGLTIADANDEVWLFEICGPGPFWTQGSGEPGAVWVAQRIPDDHVSVIANRARIGEINLDDPDNFMASSNIYSVAKEFGWWDESQPFVFHKVYNPEPYGSPAYQSRREWRVFDLLAPSLGLDPYADEYPFSVKPDEPVTPQKLMAIYRDHYEGTEFDLTVGMAAGPFGNPNRYPTPTSVKPEGMGSLDWERAISLFRCSYSFVGQVRSWLPKAMAGVLWFGEDVPHSTVYIPLYAGITAVPESFSSGRRDIFDPNSAWWAFNFVSNWADLKYNYMMEDITAKQAEFEDNFFAMQPAVELAAETMFKSNPELAIKYLTDYSYNACTNVVNSWWELAADLIAKYDDGYVGMSTSVGYPTWWLEAVGFGETMKDM
jgi:dipeptidase